MSNTPVRNASAPVVLITGASSGIGAALAEQYARDGYTVLLAARSVDKLQALASRLQAQHKVHAEALFADLEAADGAQALHAEVRARGHRLSALVNNAGYGLFGEFEATRLQAEHAMMQLNMNSLVSLTKLFLPDLKAQRGSILNVASTAAFQPGPYMAVYYATKAFVLSFSEAIAEELRGQVTVTALCPGPTASGFQDKAAMQGSALVNGKKLPTAQAVAQAGYAAVKRGQRVFIPGVMNWLMAQSIRYTPRRVVTWLVRQMSKPVTA
jgi:uncharacterized protein